MTTSRRLFLKSLGASALTAAALSQRPSFFTAHGAETSGYKALVCVFLFGGLDNHDTLIPYDTASYNELNQIRGGLFGQHNGMRARSALLPIAPATNAVLGGRQIALPPEMPGLKSLFDRGQAAIVGNVGPLIEPVTRASFESGAVRLPPRLFSHNDQQAIWQSSAPEGAQFGWGGLFADAILSSGANSANPQFTTIASEEVGPFLTGRAAVPYRISPAGAARVNYIDDLSEDIGAQSDLVQAIRRQLAATSYDGSHVLERDIAGAFSGGLDTNDAYDAARRSGVALTTQFPASPLGAQLRAVAETISVRDRLLASRQIYFVGMGGFDTHSAQASSLPQLLSQIDGALVAFNAAMVELGLSNDVTLFTASDFGRTLAINGDGTDHGWGAHHFVIGGAVKGGEIYGSVPPSTFGHEADSGGGRLIPSVAVEQYAAELGRWFGLTQSELDSALPNLRNFDALPMSFI